MGVTTVEMGNMGRFILVLVLVLVLVLGKREPQNALSEKWLPSFGAEYEDEYEDEYESLPLALSPHSLSDYPLATPIVTPNEMVFSNCSRCRN